MTAPLVIVAAALVGADGRVLVQQRRHGAEHGGLWEFPGGKAEAGEHPILALHREIGEELGIVLVNAAIAPLGFATTPPGAAERAKILLLYECTAWTGAPRCLAGEAIAWHPPAGLGTLAMPPLDRALIGAVQRRTI